MARTDERLFQLDPARLRIDPARYSFSFPDIEKRNSLAESVGQYGVLRPPLVVEDGSGWLVVDGVRRLDLLLEAGAEQVWVRSVSEDYLWDRLLEERAGEGFNVAEAGLYLKKRMDATGETPEQLAPKVFPKLGLPPKPGACADPLWIAGLDERYLARFAEGEIAAAGARALRSVEMEEALAVLDATEGMRLGANKFVETARWLMECAWRDGVGVAQWLQSAELPEGQEFRQKLWELRHPNIAEWSRSFASDAGSLGLPKAARLAHSPGFEGGRLQLTISFGSVEELEECASEVAEKAAGGGLAKLEKYLG